MAKFDPLVGGDASLLYSTYLGGSANDRGLALALSGPDQVFVTGLTQSSDFPLANAYDNTFAGGTCGTRSCYDAFVFHLDLAANSLVYSTCLGGTSDEEGRAIAASSSGNAYITGYTKSTDFPVLEAIQASKGADGCAAPPCEDAFLTKLGASGSALVYSTYLGGGGDDQGNGIALDGNGDVYLAGEGNSSDFPVTPGAYDTTLNGTKDDVFIVKISEAAAPPASWTTTYTYTYDPLYRLVGAAYSSGEFFEYAYDAVGNRLSETSHVGTTNYTYDNANRLTGVNGVPYTWDANGNLLSDGVYTYTYDHANRLVSVTGPSSSVSYAYNGLGDRLQQTVDGVTENYTLDLNNWLTQVLADGTQTYLYGTGRIAQYNASGAEYFLADALGSVKQLADGAGGVQLSKTYEPFGKALNDAGTVATSYGFTGEWTDGYIELLYLRSRMYDPRTGRFLTKDSWQGNYTKPMSYNKWLYTDANPVNLVDPSGHFPVFCQYAPSKALYEACVLAYYQVEPINYLSLGSNITGEKGCYEGKIDYRAPGYLEGVGGFVGPLLGDYIPSTWGGVETVYDFATMERSSFWYTGPGISDAFLGVGIAQYGGGVAGFRSNADINTDCEGPFWVLQGGISVDFFIGFGAGIGGFVSTSDILMRGMTWYVGGSISLSDWIEGIDVGGAYLDYKFVDGSRKSYVSSFRTS